MIDGPIRERRGPRFYRRLGCASCLVVGLLNVALLGASTVVMVSTLMPASGVRPAPLSTAQLVNDTDQTVYVQPGTCSATVGCNFGFGKGVDVQPGRSFPVTQFPATPGASFVYRVSDASGKVLGCARAGDSGASQINSSTLPACP